MNKPERITLSRAEYNAMIERMEDLEDAIELGAFEIALKKGEVNVIGADLVRAMIEGMHPLRAWRKQRRLTLAALGQRAGVPVSSISEIETGKATGTVPALRKLATALGLTIDDIVR